MCRQQLCSHPFLGSCCLLRKRQALHLGWSPPQKKINPNQRQQKKIRFKFSDKLNFADKITSSHSATSSQQQLSFGELVAVSGFVWQSLLGRLQLQIFVRQVARRVAAKLLQPQKNSNCLHDKMVIFN